MPLEKFKDTTINEIEFRIGLLPARTGDWMITQMGLNKFGDMETYSKIQDLLLGVCSVYVQGNDGVKVPMRLYENGRFLVKQFADLEYDIDTIHCLVEEALDFNIGPFFAKLKAKERASREA